jgi:hypothetical protein
VRTQILAHRDLTFDLLINKLNNNNNNNAFKFNEVRMPIYQRAGLTAEVPIIKPIKNTIQHKPITNTQKRKH